MSDKIKKIHKTKAKVLTEALLFMNEYKGYTFVIKYAGPMDFEDIDSFASDVVLLKQVGINPVIVHGGGKIVGALLEEMGIESSFIDGQRITNHKSLAIIEMVLSGSVNKKIVSRINEAGGAAVGLSGKDANLIAAKRVKKMRKTLGQNIEQIIDMGYVGEVTDVMPDILIALEESDVIPVIAPIAYGENRETYNLNSDDVAGAIAEALSAKKLIIMGENNNIYDSNKEIIKTLTTSKLRKFIQANKNDLDKTLLHRLEISLRAIENTTDAVHLLDSSIEHALLLEVFTDSGVGTKITLDP